MGCFMSLGFGSYMFAIAFVKILKDELISINKMASHRKSRKNMYKKLPKFVQAHANLKQLSSFTNKAQNERSIFKNCFHLLQIVQFIRGFM